MIIYGGDLARNLGPGAQVVALTSSQRIACRSVPRSKTSRDSPLTGGRPNRRFAASSTAEEASENLANLQGLREAFQQQGLDEDGSLDKDKFRQLLRQVVQGLQPFTLDWLKEVELEEIVFSYDRNKDGKVSLAEFEILVQDCFIIDHKFQEYRRAFDAIDSSGDGTLNGSEISELFRSLGQPISPAKLAKLMEATDRDTNGRLDFFEFLGIFRHELLDLNKIEEFLKLRAAAPAKPRSRKLVEATPGQVLMFFSAAEFDLLLESHAKQLIVLEAGLSWCRPCKGFEKTYQKFAEFYDQAIFLRFYGNSNETCRQLFANRIHATATPDFSFYREGCKLHQFTGANASKLNQAMQTLLLDDENPLADAAPFRRQT